VIIIETISKTEEQLFLEMEVLRTRLDATERRLQEASEILQAQIAECKRAEEIFGKAQKHVESIVETIREPLIVLTPDLSIPQYIEVPPNIEVKQIVLYFSPVLSC
jgi:cell division septum initiation protein DivIVA